MFSVYPTSVPFPVVPIEEWSGDGWDPLRYGRDVDLFQSFFSQFFALQREVPQPALTATRNENCEYCNNLSDNKNCYMVFNTSLAEDCMYCENAWGSRDCVECTHTRQSELCYDCTACTRCYALQSSEYCEDCQESTFLSLCRSCKHCFGCVNLRRREYCIFNEQKTRDEYEAFLHGFDARSRRQRAEMDQRWRELCLRHPRPHAILRQTEDVSGNFILEAKDVHDSFFIQHGENLRHCFNLHEGIKDCRDYSLFGRRAELIYECATCGIDIQRLAFCYQCRAGSSDLLYCWHCDACEQCFGCVSLNHKKYCILNKQYTKEEYEALMPKLIEQMRQAGEWGEFFPLSRTPHPYNRSQAQRHFPLTKNQALEAGLTWHEEPVSMTEAIDSSALPDSLPQTDDSMIVQSALSGRPFKITSQELKRYRQFNVPLPRMTYDERMEERAKKLGGIHLYDRACAKTGRPIRTTYPPESPFILWDRDVYEQEFGE
ncbi:MAG: Uncharacterized protein G01um101425_124 [Candidatus Peregrinibacteria bacterium Gr01-1014_25]|nr:MAG: Uncharacterized protein G01um101425_124 [Candidatus Peregrinibacteria bacterium Gr01-1014_25]